MWVYFVVPGEKEEVFVRYETDSSPREGDNIVLSLGRRDHPMGSFVVEKAVRSISIYSQVIGNYRPGQHGVVWEILTITLKKL